MSLGILTNEPNSAYLPSGTGDVVTRLYFKGDDTLDGGLGTNSYLYSGSNNGFDTFIANSGTNILSGSGGNDVIGLKNFASGDAETIAGNAPLTISAVKMAVAELLKDENERDMGSVAAAVKHCFDSKDYIEGRTAFMEKRKPAFTGV